MAVDRKYQVFISSTFLDLKAERQAVLKAILELGHMPAGMELFPATDDSAWQLIRDVIDASDYYIVIIGGRYGSLDEAGISFTEKEYDYAYSVKKPVIPLLHQNPDNLPRGKTDTDPNSWKRLEAFRAKVSERHTCVFWQTVDELKAQVILGITASIKRHPAIGWVRADQVPSEATIAEVLALRNKLADLEAKTAASQRLPPTGTEDLEQGEDEFEIGLSFTARTPGLHYGGDGYTGRISLSWSELFAGIAPSLIHEAADYDLRRTFSSFVAQRYREAFGNKKELKGKELVDFHLSSSDFDTALIQFRALGFIEESVRPRSVKDTTTYWCLTSYGDFLMTQLRAVRKRPLEKDGPPAKAAQGDAQVADRK